MAGLEVAEAPESLLIARFLDLGALAIVPFSFLVLSCRSINTALSMPLSFNFYASIT